MVELIGQLSTWFAVKSIPRSADRRSTARTPRRSSAPRPAGSGSPATPAASPIDSWTKLPVASVSLRPSVAATVNGRVTSSPPSGRGAEISTRTAPLCPGARSMTGGLNENRTARSGSCPRNCTRRGRDPPRLSANTVADAAAPVPGPQHAGFQPDRHRLVGRRRRCRLDEGASLDLLGAVGGRPTENGRVASRPGLRRVGVDPHLGPGHLPRTDLDHRRPEREPDAPLRVGPGQGHPPGPDALPVVDDDLELAARRVPDPDQARFEPDRDRRLDRLGRGDLDERPGRLHLPRCAVRRRSTRPPCAGSTPGRSRAAAPPSGPGPGRSRRAARPVTAARR